MGKDEKSIREIWEKLDNGAEPVTKREKMVAKKRKKLSSSMANVAKGMQVKFPKPAFDIMAPIRAAVKKIEKDWAETFAKLAKYVKQHREEFDRRYEAYYPQMKAHLRKRLALKENESANMPISNDDMWELWISEIAPYADWERNLEREDFIYYHNLIEESLSRIGIKNDLKTLAIKITADGKNLVCEKYLTKFVYRDDKELSANKFFNDVLDEDSKAEVGSSTFSGWVKEYKENLKELRCAQQK